MRPGVEPTSSWTLCQVLNPVSHNRSSPFLVLDLHNVPTVPSQRSFQRACSILPPPHLKQLFLFLSIKPNLLKSLVNWAWARRTIWGSLLCPDTFVHCFYTPMSACPLIVLPPRSGSDFLSHPSSFSRRVGALHLVDSIPLTCPSELGAAPQTSGVNPSISYGLLRGWYCAGERQENRAAQSCLLGLACWRQHTTRE